MNTNKWILLSFSACYLLLGVYAVMHHAYFAAFVFYIAAALSVPIVYQLAFVKIKRKKGYWAFLFLLSLTAILFQLNGI